MKVPIRVQTRVAEGGSFLINMEACHDKYIVFFFLRMFYKDSGYHNAMEVEGKRRIRREVAAMEKEAVAMLVDKDQEMKVS
jgi:hypothetical protein